MTLESFSKPVKKQKKATPFLYCVVLRITAPTLKSNDSASALFKKNRFDKKVNQKATYKKCILLADLADDNQLTGVILEESNEDHNRLFQRDLSLQHVAVGQRCVILTPRIEGNQMKNGAWVISTNRPIGFVQAPRIPTCPLRCERIGHEIRYYTIKNTKIFLLDDDVVDPIKTKCNFHSCDRQNAKQMGTLNNCGCWMQNRRSDTGPRNTVLMFTFYFQDTSGKIIKVADFTSLRTSRLFFNDGNILSDTETLQRNEVYEYMQDQW